MTALSKYERLETTGLWRETPEAQRREVVVSFGNATIVLSDMNNTALAHWSLHAIHRLNPKQRPAIYSPDEDDITETLEIEDDTMIGAIEEICTEIERHRPHPRRLRWWLLAGSFAMVAALAFFWLPGALLRQTLSVVPEVKRYEIGQTLATKIKRIAGQPCSTRNGNRALAMLEERLSGDQEVKLLVLPAGMPKATHLPGGFILLNRALVEDYEEPDVPAGYILAEQLRSQLTDPMEPLLRSAGVRATFGLLTTGEIPDAVLDDYAEELLTAPQTPLDAQILLGEFQSASLRSSPYAYAEDPTGETTIELIEADPFITTAPTPVLSDGEWVALQNICSE